jgi:hypothetical protein
MVRIPSANSHNCYQVTVADEIGGEIRANNFAKRVSKTLSNLLHAAARIVLSRAGRRVAIDSDLATPA